jgi:UDP-N-acetylmuramoyl-tripeptide--D-alanyl-D-alanine ligase
VTATLAELARDCGGTLQGDASQLVNGISTDTRSLEPGALFVAIAGEHFDGHRFVDEAVARGARALLVSREIAAPGDTGVIRVADTVEALGALARARRERFAGPVVAVTGSNGKTTTREMCSAILEAAGHRVHRSPGNFNNEIGLPLSILGLEDHDTALVVELGMNHPGEIDRLGAIASPSVGAITQVAPAHLGPVGSIDAIATAKGELLERIRPDGVAVLNADDGRVMAQRSRFAGRALTFGASERADVRALGIETGGCVTRFRLQAAGRRTEVSLAAPGRHQVWNALCAAAAAWGAGVSEAELGETARAGLERFRPVSGRLVSRMTPSGVHVLDDTYNANPVSVEAALRALDEIAGAARRVAILGDMLELGPEAVALHEQTGEVAARSGVDVLIGVGELSRHTAAAADREGVAEVASVPDAAAASELAATIVHAGDAVLVKGSRGMRLESVVRTLIEGEA